MSPDERAVHEAFMRRAIELAERGRWSTAPNPTVGALLVKDGQVVAEGWHQVCGQAHAEVNCLRDAAAKGVDPAECTLYVTLEPCPMCMGAIINSRLGKVVYGAKDAKAGACGSVIDLRSYPFNHKPLVKSGFMAEECASLLTDFFKKRR
jgi:diaminohydroxyphosphoribosylaminopyrimidine deaminase/5-amino-6-(5-phosphoribosylamino)uracil reductase